MATPAPATLGSGPDQFELDLSEDYYAGDAMFTVSVDGVQIGGPQTVTARHGTPVLSQKFFVQGDFGIGPHTVGVTFLNDAFGGTAATDRNLYVDQLISGPGYFKGASLYFGGTKTFTIFSPPRPVTIGTGPNAITLNISEDAYKGDAQFTIAVDGVQYGGIQTTTATHTAPGVFSPDQVFTVLGNFSGPSHVVTVNFLNDLFDGTRFTDRNLYVDSISVPSHYSNDPVALLSNGPHDFVFVMPQTYVSSEPQTVGTGPDSLVLNVHGDAYDDGNGYNAQFSVSVDGQQIGGVLTTGSRDTFNTQAFTLRGTFGAGAHTITVTFLNDAFGTGPGQDRNLYVDTAINGGLVTELHTPLFYTGSSTTFTANVPGATLTGSTLAGQMENYAILSGTPGNDSITAQGDGNNVILGTAGDKQNGQTDQVGIAGNRNTVVAGDENTTVTGTGTGTGLTLGNGNETVTLDGAGTFLEVGVGTNTIALTGGSANVLIGGSSTVTRFKDSVTIDGENNRVSARVTNGKFVTAGDVTITGGSGHGTFYLGAGTGTISTGGLYNTISVGYYDYGPGKFDITPGNGFDTVLVSSSNVGDITTVHLAGTHNTVNTSNVAVAVTGGDGQNTVTLGVQTYGARVTDTVTLGGENNTVNLLDSLSAIDAGSGHETINLYGGKASLVFHGSGNILFDSGPQFYIGQVYNPTGTVDDFSSDLQVYLSPSLGSLDFKEFGPAGVIHLQSGAGSFTTADQAFAALTPDAAGGSTLMVNAASIHFAPGIPLSSNNFQIG